ncbi:hypothetical protein GCM10009601_20690 [Streptomyces thermospinosisporus]|uniref:DUF6875 domain-containing protein n=1 Tax=Streptomyces thermospinosisporus TaxID=161482 RepID=A0ABP4JIL8_9ACTN
MPDIDVRLTEPAAETTKLIDDWLTGYITKPHAELGRSGPVCPFVEPSRRAGCLVLYGAEWRPEFGLPHMVDIVDSAVECFAGHAWDSRNSNLHSLIVAVPDLPPDAYWLIDKAHELTKDRIVARGLMLGQFHPACEEPAARNSRFPVNRSPVPLFAVRNMALHDILFLHTDDVWFAEYERHHGRHYEKPDRIAPDFVRLFEAARARRAREPHGRRTGSSNRPHQVTSRASTRG